MLLELRACKQCFVVIFFIIVICTPSRASFEDLGIGARQQGMGEAFTGLANTSEAIFWNPAGLARVSAFEIATYYSRPFGIKELAHNAVSLAMPLKNYRAGVGIQTYGYSAYRENSYSLGLAGNYQNKLFYGLTVKYFSLSIKNYGTAATIGLDLGLLVNYSPRLAFGFTAKNINRPKIGSQNQVLPQIFVSGLLLRPSPNLNVTLDLYKDVHFPLDPRAGIEYQLFSKIWLRAGTAWEPARYSLGFGLKFSYFQIDYAFHSHPTLNLTHLFSFTFSRKQPPAYRTIPQSTRLKTKPRNIKLAPGETININTANLAELIRLPGVGKKTAQAIIDYRNSQGAFVNLTELTELKGIGPKKFKTLRPYLRLKD